MPNIIGQITETTANITIQLTSAGSDRPDNFKVEIAQWNTGSVTSGNTRTIVTGLTRTQTSTLNGGSLTVAPYYEIAGIGPMDYALITTATGDCQTVDTDQVLSTALSVYNPGNNGEISPETSIVSPTMIQYSYTPQPITTTATQNIALFSTLPFGNLGYYEDYNLSGFTITHESSKDSSNNTIYGDFQYGPLNTLRIVNHVQLGSQNFIIQGNQIGNISSTKPGPNLTVYRITWDLSGNYTLVDFYWDANGNA